MVAVRGAPVPEVVAEPRVRSEAGQKLAAPAVALLAAAETAAAVALAPLAWKAAGAVPVAVAGPLPGEPPRRPAAVAGLRC